MANFHDIVKLPPVKFGGKIKYPLFTRISLETSKTCTRTCWFCPSEKRGKKQEVMSPELYAKILSELRSLEWGGVVQWFLLNEPLMDREWPTRIADLRAACPKATIHVTTNWDPYHRKTLPEQIALIGQLFDAGVNSLNLNDYDKRGYAKTAQAAAKKLGVKLLDSQCWSKLSSRKKVLSAEFGSENLHTWSGYVNETKIREENYGEQRGKGRCARPMRHLVIQYDGRVPLCCAVDTTRPQAEFFGDLNKESIVDVWNSKQIFEYRERLQRGERSGECEGCTATVAYPHVVRRVRL